MVMYRVPMPNGTNGVRLYTLPGQQIGIEYQRGKPQVGGLAYDSKHGLARDVSFDAGENGMAGGISDEIVERLLEFLETQLPPDAVEAVQTILGGGDVGEKYDTGSGEYVHTPAMDAALARTSKATTTATIKRIHAIRAAQERVKPWVPGIDAMPPQTSAEAVYRLALDEMRVLGADTMHPDALWQVLKAQPKPGTAHTARGGPVPSRPHMAMDSAGDDDAEFARLFPGASKLKVR
jgi:hypothetical protein